MGLQSRQRDRVSLGWSQERLTRSLGMFLATAAAAIVFALSVTLITPTSAVAQDVPQNSNGSAAPPDASGGEPRRGDGDGGNSAAGNDTEGEPRTRRRWFPRPPSGPGCPFRERKLELIV